mgnify:CR=1 FL=1
MAGRRVGIVMFAMGVFMLALGALKITRMRLGAESLMIGCLLGVMLQVNCFILGLLWPKGTKTDNLSDDE